MNNIGKVLASQAGTLEVEIDNLEIYEQHKHQLQGGQFLLVADGNRDAVVAVIQNIRGQHAVRDGNDEWSFLLNCQPVGRLVDDGARFLRGVTSMPVPMEPVRVAGSDVLELMFATSAEYSFQVGRLARDHEMHVRVHGDRFFGKHVAVVGSTGSGKSCAVASLLQSVVGIADGANKFISDQRNSHIVLFDMHAEYRAAFSLKEPESFTLSVLDVDTLALPYWLMNAEELESIFIEGNEENAHNQVSRFKHAVVRNKKRHSSSPDQVTYDSPVYFSIQEVYNYIWNLNEEVIGKESEEHCPKLVDGTLVKDRDAHYFDSKLTFVQSTTKKGEKASNGPFYGEFNKFISRLETKLEDDRLRFLLAPQKKDGSAYASDDFSEIVKQFVGYIDKSNVTVVDLSGVPFEVLGLVVSLVSRLVFDLCFHYSKTRHNQGFTNNVPMMLVCEEAHNYVPQSDLEGYRASRKSIERIAKEGRKYGISLMVVSQRPSEVSDTILAQCSNFLALRLTNSRDQQYVRRLLPDDSAGIADVLPTLGPGEGVLVGDAVLIPSIVQLEMPSPAPHSSDVPVHEEWQKPWQDLDFAEVLKRWSGK